MKSLYFKNFLISTGLVLMSFLILGVVFVILGRGVLVSERQENMIATVEEVMRTAKAYRSDSGSRGDDSTGWRSLELRVLLSTISTVSGHQVFLSDADGVVVSCSDKPGQCPHINRVLGEPVMSTLETDGYVNAITDLGGFYQSVYYVIGIPIYNADRSAVVGYAFASTESGLLMGTWHTFLSLFSMTAVAILVVAMIMSYITSKRMARPLNEMTAAARHFAHGDFSARVNECGIREDELGELTAAFNNMAESLEKADEQKYEFLANVSHELKTPMTTISGFADGILDGTIPKENQDTYLMTISSETKRLSRLVRKMLELAQIQETGSDELQNRSFDISETLRQTLINFEKKITEKGLDVEVLLPEESMMVRGDKDAITQVVYNLLDNAIKFAEADSVIGLSLWKQGGKAFVSVKNHGDTISEQQLNLIFDRFHKTDRSRSQDRDGVGLGLYIVKSILNNHNEDISATSRDGTTEFVFSLTLQQDKKRPEPKPPAAIQ